MGHGFRGKRSTEKISEARAFVGDLHGELTSVEEFLSVSSSSPSFSRIAPLTLSYLALTVSTSSFRSEASSSVHISWLCNKVRNDGSIHGLRRTWRVGTENHPLFDSRSVSPHFTPVQHNPSAPSNVPTTHNRTVPLSAFTTVSLLFRKNDPISLPLDRTCCYLQLSTSDVEIFDKWLVVLDNPSCRLQR